MKQVAAWFAAWWLALALTACGDGTRSGATAPPQVEVEVLETWPPGSRVALAGNRNYTLRLAFRSDAPVRIWARPYYRGNEVPTATHPSGLHAGSGETFGWFQLREPGLRVDEVRISAGNGTARGTREVARHRVDVVAAGGMSTAVEPDWIPRHRAQAEARQRAEASGGGGPAGAFDGLWVGAVVGAVPVLGLLGLIAPVMALRRWRGGWRVAASLPLLALGLVLLNIVVGTAFDPTSHNLWPFEILMVSIPGLAWIAVLALARRRGRVSGARAPRRR